MLPRGMRALVAGDEASVGEDDRGNDISLPPSLPLALPLSLSLALPLSHHPHPHRTPFPPRPPLSHALSLSRPAHGGTPGLRAYPSRTRFAGAADSLRRRAAQTYPSQVRVRSESHPSRAHSRVRGGSQVNYNGGKSVTVRPPPHTTDGRASPPARPPSHVHVP